jgi:MoxR-like ATPase
MSFPWIGQGKTSKNVLRALRACEASHQAAVIVGNPGEGKTAMVFALAKALNPDNPRPVVYLSMASIQSEDMTGLPCVKLIENDGHDAFSVTEYALNDWQKLLIDHDDAVLFLDELNTAPPSTMKTLLPIIQSRIFANRKTFSDNVFIVGAVNPAGQSQGFELPAALKNRITWIPFNMGCDDWSAGMLARWQSDVPMKVPEVNLLPPAERYERERMIARTVVDFVHNNHDVFSEFNSDIRDTAEGSPEVAGILPSNKPEMFVFEQAIASGRTWDDLVRLLSCFDDSLFDDNDEEQVTLLRTLVNGTIGYIMGQQYILYVQGIFKNRVTIDQFMDPVALRAVNWDHVTIDQMVPLFSAMERKAAEGEIKAIIESLIWLKNSGYDNLLQSASAFSTLYNNVYFTTAMEKHRFADADECRKLRHDFVNAFADELHSATTMSRSSVNA